MTKYKRILLKLSGEALASDSSFGIEPKILDDVVSIIKSVKDLGVEIAIVIGGGNLFRGAKLAKAGINRVTADHMGMLATVMNALAIQDVCKRNNIASEVMSGFAIAPKLLLRSVLFSYAFTSKYAFPSRSLGTKIIMQILISILKCRYLVYNHGDN